MRDSECEPKRAEPGTSYAIGALTRHFPRESMVERLVSSFNEICLGRSPDNTSFGLYYRYGIMPVQNGSLLMQVIPFPGHSLASPRSC